MVLGGRREHAQDYLPHAATTSHFHAREIAEDRIEMDLHDGDHEVHVESGLRFLTKWLKESGVRQTSWNR